NKNNNRFITSEEHAGLVNRVFHLEMDMDQMKNDFSHLIVNEKVLYENTELDSLAFISQLVESVKESLILIDPFASVRTLIPFKFKKKASLF
ncbi:MAG: hypothetical protein K5925_00670, partial [Bacilli bacterium]|nr:hypothetical protein [Bacilli bacterium]